MSKQDDCYDLLVRAIVMQAIEDLSSHDKTISQDARGFFRSTWFTELTGVDGHEILRKHGFYS